jgi:hypothetical protein
MKDTTPITAKGLLIEVLCGLPVLLFVYSAAVKLSDFKRSRGEMLNQPFPHWLAMFFAYTIPVVELAIACALVVGAFGFERVRTRGLWATVILMLLFSGYAAAIMAHVFPRVPCSCGGVIHNLSWGQHLVLNLFIVSVSVAALRLRRLHGLSYGDGQPVIPAT